MAQENKTVSITWLGTAGVLISDGATGILIDPYVSRFGLFKIALNIPLQPDKASIKKWTDRLGAKNIGGGGSHSHFDHCLDAPYFAQETGALLIGSESTINVGSIKERDPLTDDSVMARIHRKSIPAPCHGALHPV
ncbi:MAG: hypothetical protein WBN66_06570 [Smithella sp.]